jgi:hypothetical protein
VAIQVAAELGTINVLKDMELCLGGLGRQGAVCVEFKSMSGAGRVWVATDMHLMAAPEDLP